MICLGSDQMVDHIDGRAEEDLDIGIAGSIGDRFGQEGFTGSGVSDKDHIHMVSDKVEAEEVEDTALLILS